MLMLISVLHLDDPGSQPGNDCPDSWSSHLVKAIKMLPHRHAKSPVSQVESVPLTMDSDNHRIEAASLSLGLTGKQA